MFLKTIILLVFCLSFQEILSNKENGINIDDIKVNRIKIEDAPYQVALYPGLHFCGGSIIGHNKILTVAVCVRTLSPYQIVVVAGTENRFSNETRLRVSQISIHPRYNSKTGDYDVAVLTTSTSFTFSSRISAVELLSERPAAGTKAKVSGWGTRIARCDTSLIDQYLREVRVLIVDQNTCRTRYGSFFTNRMICVGLPAGGKDMRQGIDFCFLF